MTTDLEETLRTAGADLHLDRPVSGVLARGDRLRHRRNGLRVGAAALCLAAAGGVAWLAVPSGSPSTTVKDDVATDPSSSAAGPSPTPAAEPLAGLTPDAFAAADSVCRNLASFKDMAPDTVAAATDTSDGTSVLFYQDADHVAVCTVQAGKDGKPHPVSLNISGRDPLPAGHAFGTYGFVYGSGTRGGPIPDAPGAFLISDYVARLVLHFDGQDFEARVGPNVAVVWLPAGSNPNHVALDAIVTAYAADGTELDSGELLDRPAPF